MRTIKVSRSFTEKEHTDISLKQYDDEGKKYVGDPIKIDTESGNVVIGYVHEVIDDKSTGLQAYVVTDRKVQTPEDFGKVKEVLVLYQGSVGLDLGKLDAEMRAEFYRSQDDETNLTFRSKEEKQAQNEYTTALLKDWWETNKKTIDNIYWKKTDNPPKQFLEGAELLNKSMKQFPNATFDLSGHSLGGMLVQFAIACALVPERIRSARSYSAPNIYNTLTDAMKENAQLVSNRFIMFYDRFDLVQTYGNVEYIGDEAFKSKFGSRVDDLIQEMADHDMVDGELSQLISKYGQRPLPAVGKMVMIDSLKAKNIVKQHLWGGYQYDEKGMPLLLNTTQDDTSILMGALLAIQRYDQMWQKGLYQKLAHIRESYSTEFRLGPDMAQATGIYIDAEQALTVLNGAQASVTAVFHDFRADLNRALSEAETLWADIESKVYQTAQHLSIMEAFAILASEGISEATIVGPVRERVAREESLIAEYEQAYKNLAQNIKTGIKDLVSRDRESAHLIEF